MEGKGGSKYKCPSAQPFCKVQNPPTSCKTERVSHCHVSVSLPTEPQQLKQNITLLSLRRCRRSRSGRKKYHTAIYLCLVADGTAAVQQRITLLSLPRYRRTRRTTYSTAQHDQAQKQSPGVNDIVPPPGGHVGRAGASWVMGSTCYCCCFRPELCCCCFYRHRCRRRRVRYCFP